MISKPEGCGPLFDVGSDDFSRQALLLMRLQEEQQRVLDKRNLVNRALSFLSPLQQSIIADALIVKPVVYSRPVCTVNHGSFAMRWEEGITFKATRVDFDGGWGHPEVSQPVVDVRRDMLFPTGGEFYQFEDEDAVAVHGLAEQVKSAYWNGQLPDLSGNCTSLYDPQKQPWARPRPLPMGPILQNA